MHYELGGLNESPEELSNIRSGVGDHFIKIPQPNVKFFNERLGEFLRCFWKIYLQQRETVTVTLFSNHASVCRNASPQRARTCK